MIIHARTVKTAVVCADHYSSRWPGHGGVGIMTSREARDLTSPPPVPSSHVLIPSSSPPFRAQRNHGNPFARDPAATRHGVCSKIQPTKRLRNNNLLHRNKMYIIFNLQNVTLSMVVIILLLIILLLSPLYADTGAYAFSAYPTDIVARDMTPRIFTIKPKRTW